MSSQSSYDLLVIGGTAAGLSAAIEAQRAGLSRVRVLESSYHVAFPVHSEQHRVSVSSGITVDGLDVESGGDGDGDSDGGTDGDGQQIVVRAGETQYRARAVLVADRKPVEGWTPPVPVDGVPGVTIDELPDNPTGQDVLVVGHTDHAVELTAALANQGANVVLAAGGMIPTRLAPASGEVLNRLEKERLATLLYRAVPEQLSEVGGHPMAFFGDRQTPDLQFDRVVFASRRHAPDPATLGVSDAALASGRVFFAGERAEAGEAALSAPAWKVGHDILTRWFPEVEAPALPTESRHVAQMPMVEELREEHYNATITHFEPTHSDLWVLRVKPDHGSIDHVPGQYASLGLGFWEPRIDNASDHKLEDRWDKLVRRSYSISCRMFDEQGYLVDPSEVDDLEFYIVLVSPTDTNIPGLTPRLALKKPGDRIYLGPKVTGRYTLAAVTNPNDTVIFLSTGTGEAPHNNMIIQLLRKGHRGPIVSAVTVRQNRDLGYMEQHRILENHYPNYHYMPLPTREPEVPKRYIQDWLVSDDLAQYGIDLKPEGTHVYLCGNPAMIGLPEEQADGTEKFPETLGVVQILTERGFTLERRKTPGNIHFEEYW